MFGSVEPKGIADRLIAPLRRTAYLLPLLLCSQVATATVQGATGLIVNFRLYTVSNATTLTHDVAAFQLSPAMSGTCNWVWIDPSDTKALAVVLAAKTAGTSVGINYDDAVPSPWGDGSMCVLTLIST
jgi:hypothetical protein